MQTAIVTDQGQVLIPAEIRQQLGITPGSRLHFIIDGNTIRVVQAAIKTSFPEDGYGTALFFILPFIGLSLVSCCLSACWCLGRLLAAILSFCRRPD